AWRYVAYRILDLDQKSIATAKLRRTLAWERPTGLARRVDAGGVRRNPVGQIRRSGAELARPDYIAAGDVLAHKSVDGTGAASAQISRGFPRGVDARGVHRNAVGRVKVSASELPRPLLGPAGVILAHKGIAAALSHLAWELAAGVARHVDARGVRRN